MEIKAQKAFIYDWDGQLVEEVEFPEEAVGTTIDISWDESGHVTVRKHVD